MFCSKCGAEGQEGSKFCKECGEPLTVSASSLKRGRPSLLIAITALIIAIMGTGLGLFFFFSNKEEPVQPVVETEKSVPVTTEVKVVKSEPQEKTVSENQPKPKSKREIIQEAQSKVFTVFTSSSQGSSFLLNAKGDLVTNAHVVAGYTEVIVKDQSGTEYSGRIIGISDQVDIALIRVDQLSGMEPLPMELNHTPIGSEVIALGSPRGLENTASIGYVTGLNRDIEGDYHYEKMYQIDAQVSPGSSGGPLLDGISGAVIGINSAVLIADQSIAFSIPFYIVNDQLMAWSQNPMTADAVQATFDFYEEYQDYWFDENAWEDEYNNTPTDDYDEAWEDEYEDEYENSYQDDSDYDDEDDSDYDYEDEDESYEEEDDYDDEEDQEYFYEDENDEADYFYEDDTEDGEM
ncbi:trypsin-like peptidase domain-containing protein [Lederbergia citrea]|uniref:trypsin-like peptidase domain-containing protein n=1 Tax=Lederbergia citrea TaxID=2833581 RepID=UPI001BC98440|nr:trypsin-like peptidase domain-containing protein [Lederbergia citrea]MBS4205697.1 trypsin-like peptidase domain-containing protein [Lederbergia citrea]